MDDVLWLALSRVRGIGIKKLIALTNLNVSRYGLHSAAVMKITGERLFKLINEEGCMDRLIYEAEQDVHSSAEKGIHIIPYTSDSYPELLRFISDPPVVLYCRGNPEALGIFKKAAVVGTRWPTEKGRETASKTAAALVERGYAVVSGLAAGIDTAAHAGALKAGGTTIAVLPGDLENIYPYQNRKLAERIAERGGVLVTEYPPGTGLQKRFFVERDRIQSGMSLGVVVVQTEISGGAMHTANFCRLQKRLLFCSQPAESLEIPQNSGIEKLLKEGALIFENHFCLDEIEAMLYDNYIMIRDIRST